MSQLLCEQVVGRGLRRARYDLTADGKFSEEVAKVLGVPFEVIPMKTSGPSPRPPEKRYHVYAVPEKGGFEISFPRVESYTQAIRNRVTVDWTTVAKLVIDPSYIPPEVEMKATVPNNQGRMTLSGPGRLDDATLHQFRAKRRLQELVFELAKTLTRDHVEQPRCDVPAHVLSPSLCPSSTATSKTRWKSALPRTLRICSLRLTTDGLSNHNPRTLLVNSMDHETTLDDARTSTSITPRCSIRSSACAVNDSSQFHYSGNIGLDGILVGR